MSSPPENLVSNDMLSPAEQALMVCQQPGVLSNYSNKSSCIQSEREKIQQARVLQYNPHLAHNYTQPTPTSRDHPMLAYSRKKNRRRFVKLILMFI